MAPSISPRIKRFGALLRREAEQHDARLGHTVERQQPSSQDPRRAAFGLDGDAFARELCSGSVSLRSAAEEGPKRFERDRAE